MGDLRPSGRSGAGTPTASGPLTVALYTPGWPKGELPNGIVTYAAHMVPALCELGARVFVLAGQVGSGCTDPFVSVPSLQRESLAWRLVGRLREPLQPGSAVERANGLALLREVERLDREHGIDVIELEESFGWCGWLAAHTAVPVVARLHGPWFLNGAMLEDTSTRAFRGRVHREGRALARVAGISAPSRDVLERTRAHYRLPLARAEVIPNPLPEVPPAERWTAEKSEAGTLLFVGRFDNHKAGDVAVEAFARVRAKAPAARLLFAGPDPGVTDAAGRSWRIREFIRDRVPAADRAAIEVLGPQPPDVIRQLRRRAAVTIVCSRWENFPYTLGEAMTHGSPVVATATGGLVELVEDGRNGLLARPADPEDLARAILELLSDPERAARLGRCAAETSTAQLSPAAIASRTLAFYRRVIATRAGRGGGA